MQIIAMYSPVCRCPIAIRISRSYFLVRPGQMFLKNCQQAALQNLGLYGCGTTGIRADSCKNVTVRYSEMYDCSSNAVQADSTSGLLVENCDIHDLGQKEYAAGEVFWISQCTDVNIQNCSVYDNRVRSVLNC